MLTFYCISNCQTCQKAKAWLSQQEIDFVFRNIAKEPPAKHELKTLAEIGGLSLTQLVNLKGQTYKKLKPDLNSLDEDGIIRLIQEHPAIMIRPILTDGQRLVIGFKESQYQDFVR